MRKQFALAMIALFSLQLGVGCADGKSNKRAAINATHFGKATTPSGGTAPAKDSGASPQTPASGDDAHPPAGNPTGTSDQEVKDQASSDALIEKFQSLKVEGKQVAYSDLKGIKLELQEVALLYTSNSADLTDSTQVGFAHYKVVRENGAAVLSAAQASQVVGAGSAQLMGLPILLNLEIDAAGNTPSIESSEQLLLVPQVKEGKMSLVTDAAQASKTLEPVFDEIFSLNQEGDLGLSTTGAKIFTEISQSNDAVSILIEVQLSESKFQSFLLKFKTSSNVNASNGVTE